MSESISTGNTKHRPEDLIKKYGIKSSAYYSRIKFLNIKAKKDDGGKAFLTDEQVEMLDSLHEHVQVNGKMQGFFEGNQAAAESVIDETNNVDENTGTLAVSGKNELAGKASVIEQEIPESQPNFSNNMESLIRQAAEIKAQGLAMPDLVALQLSSQMTWDDLPDDLKNKVESVREAARPKIQPANIAVGRAHV